MSGKGVAADLAHAEITRIAYESPEQRASASVILEESRPDESPLHPCFTWDDNTAAEFWRLDEARYLVRSIVIVDEEEPEQFAPAFVSVVSDDGTGRGYMQTDVALTNVTTRDLVLEEAVRGLQAWRHRYGGLQQTALLIVHVDRALREADALAAGEVI